MNNYGLFRADKHHLKRNRTELFRAADQLPLFADEAVWEFSTSFLGPLILGLWLSFKNCAVTWNEGK